jgi:hypothetical protein
LNSRTIYGKPTSHAFDAERHSHHGDREGPSAAAPQPKIRNISRKDAKAAKKIVIRTWRSLRLGGKNSESENPVLEKFARAGKIVNQSSTKVGVFLIVNFESSFENWGWGWANWPTYEEAQQLPKSFPLTGKDKGRGDGFWSTLWHPYPDLSPSRGKEVQVKCNDTLPFSSSVGERKIMNHFVVQSACHCGCWALSGERS